MRLAVIDLGTNSVRFDIHQIGKDRSVRTLHREKLMVRLGQGLFTEGKLSKDAIKRTLVAFESFARIARSHSVDKMVAFATSALRDAQDSDRLLKRIQEVSGIQLKVISGHEEARLIALGILNHEKKLKGRFALLDIGGGSAELILCQGRKIHHTASFDLGVARLQQLYLKSSPPKNGKVDSPIQLLRSHIREIVNPVLRKEGWFKAPKVYGSSGTIRALSKIHRQMQDSKNSLNKKSLSFLVETMSTMNTSELLDLPGMEAKRVDMILAGAILLEELTKLVGAKSVHPTNYSLRDGILDEQLKLIDLNRDAPERLKLEELIQKIRHLGVQQSRIDSMLKLSQLLFQKLHPLHRLKPEWRFYLKAAALLHDIGEVINPVNYEKHSFYFVKEAGFVHLNDSECEFIATLCLLHKSTKIDPKSVPFWKKKSEREPFLKLLALLRLIDALDCNPREVCMPSRIQIRRDSVELSLPAKGTTPLEALRVEQKRDFFEKVFGRALIATRRSSR